MAITGHSGIVTVYQMKFHTVTIPKYELHVCGINWQCELLYFSVFVIDSVSVNKLLVTVALLLSCQQLEHPCLERAALGERKGESVSRSHVILYHYITFIQTYA